MNQILQPNNFDSHSFQLEDSISLCISRILSIVFTQQSTLRCTCSYCHPISASRRLEMPSLYCIVYEIQHVLHMFVYIFHVLSRSIYSLFITTLFCSVTLPTRSTQKYIHPHHSRIMWTLLIINSLNYLEISDKKNCNGNGTNIAMVGHALRFVKTSRYSHKTISKTPLNFFYPFSLAMLLILIYS